MNKGLKWVVIIAVYVAIGTLVSLSMLYLYHSNDFFHSLFEGGVAIATPSNGAAGGQTAAVNSELTAKMALFILTFVILLQLFASITAVWIFYSLKRSTEALAKRIRKLENADLFLDLPLYFGLFGTVSSFVIMTFNPQLSRLIAYSSTLVGIICSVILRLALQYPLKQRFINESEDGGK